MPSLPFNNFIGDADYQLLRNPNFISDYTPLWGQWGSVFDAGGNYINPFIFASKNTSQPNPEVVNQVSRDQYVGNVNANNAAQSEILRQNPQYQLAADYTAGVRPGYQEFGPSGQFYQQVYRPSYTDYSKQGIAQLPVKQGVVSQIQSIINSGIPKATIGDRATLSQISTGRPPAYSGK